LAGAFFVAFFSDFFVVFLATFFVAFFATLFAGVRFLAAVVAFFFFVFLGDDFFLATMMSGVGESLPHIERLIGAATGLIF